MILYFLYIIGRQLSLRLPLNVCYGVAVILADIYRLLAREDRSNIAYNLKVVLKTNDKKLIKGHIRNIFRNFAKYLVDFFRFSKLSRDYILNHITVKGKENIDKALAAGKGIIMLSAHLGNWELGAAIIASLGYPFYAVVLAHKDKRINDFFLEQRAICDVKVISIGVQLKNCFRILKENKLLGIIGDRDFSRQGIEANFFGRPTILPKGPAFFSLRTGALIIPTFVIRKKNDTFDIVFEEPLENKSTGNEESDIKNTIERYTSVIEQYIRSFPDQWYAFRKMWD